MKITDLRATTVTVPLEAPLLHANGAHWGRFVRTIVEVETDEGHVGLGEMGGAVRAPNSPSRASNPTFWDTTPLSLRLCVSRS